LRERTRRARQAAEEILASTGLEIIANLKPGGLPIPTLSAFPSTPAAQME
jgi:hypothetical protein